MSPNRSPKKALRKLADYRSMSYGNASILYKAETIAPRPATMYAILADLFGIIDAI